MSHAVEGSLYFVFANSDVHPYLLHSGHLLLPTFGVLAALGLMAALTLSLRTAALVGLNPDSLWNAALFTLLSAFALSRILLIATNLHNFLAYPILLLTVPSLTSTGILLTLLATLIYLRIRNLPLLDTLDAWSPPAALIWAFLALGHFAEGSDAGLPTTLPWGIHIPPIRIPPDHTRLHPVALYAAIAAAILTLLLLRQLKHRRQPGDTVALALASAGTLQFLLTFVRQPYPYTSSATYILLDPIQWIALGMIVVAAIILLLPRKLVTHAV
ncbi:prolipoprotein diacylglyceryl transferase family protein [Tunturibacter empetritectus]|uniref:Phosphatidylglycerol:prolipoprotein diacylglycerol transferase n=1 Tax=Tunturiibacter empetritectus TaxID=3069691 RepID=A0A7W8MRZ5_9BACT|nr:prolipoprotein diacylglyceryl transferase family protein [Edaphobacter lichenicola]MBB5318148.1 phosphatidylglycerol:prolipoprotein diacylglycerol transferase [Edaphobacter lichenicola]